MKTMITFEEHPLNSPQNVLEFLEAKLNFGTGEVPPFLANLIQTIGVEKEEYSGLVDIKLLLNEFQGWREGFPGLDLVPTAKEFEDFLSSPNLNSATVVQGLDHPSTRQEVSLSVLGQTPGVTLNLTMQKTLKVKVYTGTGWEIDFPDLDGGKAPDLFVELKILGLSSDERSVKTKVKKNCWTPRWGEEFQFPLWSPRDALLLVKVYDRDRLTRNDFAGAVSLPVYEIKMGIRAVALFDRKGIQCPAARLLLHFRFV